jgi:di/tricarboxylate transporter
MLIPAVSDLARSQRIAASKLMIPLSYAAILGGTCTLIGTSTNLVVSGAAQAAGLAPFSLFEITPAGVVYGIVGIAYMLLIGRRLLPERELFTEIADGSRRRQFLTEVLVPLDSPLIGKTLEEAQVARKLGARVVDLIRNRISFASDLANLVLQAGDRLMLRTNMADVIGLRQEGDVVFGAVGHHAIEPIATQSTRIMEGIVGPRSLLAGRRLAEVNLRRLFGVYILAVHRHGENIGLNFERVRLEVGDTLLLEGPAEGLTQLFAQGSLVSLSDPSEQPSRRDKGWLAVAALLGVIVLAAFDVMPISGLGLIGAAVVIAGGCLEPDEAYTAVNWPILVLIISMLAVGKAMEVTGAGRLIVDGVMLLVGNLGPHVVLSAVYLVTMLLTEFLSNNATAILVTPIAIGIAKSLGVDPRPFVVAIMFAASASFATPIGYQTNTFVYSAGGYRFMDFVRVGAPLNLLLWLVASFLIPALWPLTPN